MSLDVHLTLPGTLTVKDQKVLVRDNGAVREISKAEYTAKFPDRTPAMLTEDVSEEVFWKNITHNVGRMADEAGVFTAMWEPNLINATKARDLIEPLTRGLAKLKADPAHFKTFNPSNGWGTYEGLVDFVEEYLMACKEYPEAVIRVSR